MNKTVLWILLAFIFGICVSKLPFVSTISNYAYAQQSTQPSPPPPPEENSPGQGSGANGGPEHGHRIPPACQSIMQNAHQQVEQLRQQIKQVMETARTQCQQAVEQQKQQGN